MSETIPHSPFLWVGFQPSVWWVVYDMAIPTLQTIRCESEHAGTYCLPSWFLWINWGFAVIAGATGLNSPPEWIHSDVQYECMSRMYIYCTLHMIYTIDYVLCYIILYYIILYYIILYYIILYYIILYCNTLYSILFYSILLYNIILYYIIFYAIILSYLLLCYFMKYYTILIISYDIEWYYNISYYIYIYYIILWYIIIKTYHTILHYIILYYIIWYDTISYSIIWFTYHDVYINASIIYTDTVSTSWRGVMEVALNRPKELNASDQRPLLYRFYIAFLYICIYIYMYICIYIYNMYNIYIYILYI